MTSRAERERIGQMETIPAVLRERYAKLASELKHRKQEGEPVSQFEKDCLGLLGKIFTHVEPIQSKPVDPPIVRSTR